jgi:hypothetical protein
MGRDDELFWNQIQSGSRKLMKAKNFPYWLLIGIAVITIFSGLFQMIAPGFELRLLSAEATPAARHFFAIIGMFMVLFGGALLHALCSPADHPIVVFWAGLQKFGAFAAVGLGVLHHIFSPLALFVATFDLLSGVLVFYYWRSIRRTP